MRVAHFVSYSHFVGLALLAAGLLLAGPIGWLILAFSPRRFWRVS